MVFLFASAFKNLAGMLRTNPAGTVVTLGTDVAVLNGAVLVGTNWVRDTINTVAFGPKNAALLRT